MKAGSEKCVSLEIETGFMNWRGVLYVKQTQNLGIAMFTVRQSVERNLSGVLQKLAALGYMGIEFYGEAV